MRYCQACGHPNTDDSKFCEKCGTTLAGPAPATPTQPTTGVADTAAQALNQGANAAKGLLGKFGPLVWVGAGAVVVVLIALFIFLRPMSPNDYEDAVDDHVVEIFDAQSEVSELLWEYTEYGTSNWDPDEELDQADYDDLREDVGESIDIIEENAKKLKGLRAPGEYDTEDERLTEWADYVLKDYVGDIEELLDSISPGDSYEDVARDVERYQERAYDENSATRGFWRAAEELDLSVWGGE